MSENSVATGTRRQKILFKCTTSDRWPLVIAGDIPELGNWNLSQALVMYCQPRLQGGFDWSAQLEVLQGLTIEYKFVKKTDQGPRWESANNHRITVIPSLSTIEADFRE